MGGERETTAAKEAAVKLLGDDVAQKHPGMVASYSAVIATACRRAYEMGEQAERKRASGYILAACRSVLRQLQNTVGECACDNEHRCMRCFLDETIRRSGLA